MLHVVQVQESARLPSKPTAPAPTPPISAGGAIPPSEPSGDTPLLADSLLSLLADQHTQLERARIAFNNRVGQLTRSGPDKDGESRGFGIPEDDRLIVKLRGMADLLEEAEHGAELVMRRRLRTHRLYPWMRAINGLGEKTMARLLGVLGDPYWNTLKGRPRTVSELWAYCGLHVVQGGDPGQSARETQSFNAGIAPRRRRGEKVNWNGEARMRLYLIAEACLKQTGEPDKNGKPTPISPYRAAYNSGRIKYAEALHRIPCVRCGPAGKPTQIGSPLSDGHKHARAMRLMMKELLRDLWLEAKRLHAMARVRRPAR